MLKAVQRRDEDENLTGVGSARKRQASRLQIETLECRVPDALGQTRPKAHEGRPRTIREPSQAGENPGEDEAHERIGRLHRLDRHAGVSTDPTVAQTPEGGPATAG
jgi:hypothetical protein